MTETTKPTGVNGALVGLSYPPRETYRVCGEAIRAFAAAVGAPSPLHTDREAARSAGYRDVVAPATFAVVVAQRAEAAYLEDPEANIDFSRVVHGAESFEYFRPITAGDELAATVSVEDVTSRGAIDSVTTRCEIVDALGRPVATVRSTLVVRGAGKGA